MYDHYSIERLKDQARNIGRWTHKNYVIDHVAGRMWYLHENNIGKCKDGIQFSLSADTKKQLWELMCAYEQGIKKGMEI